MRAWTIALLAAMAVPAAARAGEAEGTSADEILRRARAAQGGARWDGIRGVRFTGTIEAGGLSGTLESLADVATGRFRDAFQLGPIAGANGWDGTRAWSKDQAGMARVDSGDVSRRAAIAEAYRRAQGWWFPHRAPADVRSAGPRYEGGRAFQVLTIMPVGGRAFDLWVADDGTFDRWVEMVDGTTITTSLSCWREVGGVKIPFVQRVTRGADPARDETITWSAVALDAPIFDAAFDVPGPPPPDFGFRGGKSQAAVPLEILNGHVYASVRLDGAGPLRMLVDTGGVNVVTPAVAKRLGLDARGALPGGGVGGDREHLAVTRVKRLELGDAWIEDQTFFVYPLDAMNPVEGVAIDGLVGYEVLRRFATCIDYVGRKLTIHRADNFRYDGAGAVIPFQFHEHVPQIDGAIDGIPGKFDLDTGSRSSLDLMSPFVAEHALVARYGARTERIGGWGVGGPSRGYVVRAGTLRLGPIEIPGPVTGLSTAQRGAFATGEVAGNVGFGILSRFTVCLDYSRQRVVLEKNIRFARPDAADRSGLWLHRVGDGFDVVEVVPGTPAADAGLRSGDRILSVDGRGARQLTLDALRTELKERPAGTRLELRVRRADGVHRIRLVLRDLV